MAETIYTIPINEAFEAGMESETPQCPFCKLFEKLENNELELILGASMMEPDIRIQTNKKGFCKNHFSKMLTRGNRLPMGLILESHLAEVCSEMYQKSLMGSPADKFLKRATELSASCYVCDRVANNFTHLIENAVYMYETDEQFREKYQNQKMICLEHYVAVLQRAKYVMSKKEFANFYSETAPITKNYFESLCEDVSWFCKKFDYRYDEEPWGNAKDSIERSVKFLVGEN